MIDLTLSWLSCKVQQSTPHALDVHSTSTTVHLLYLYEVMHEIDYAPLVAHWFRVEILLVHGCNRLGLYFYRFKVSNVLSMKEYQLHQYRFQRSCMPVSYDLAPFGFTPTSPRPLSSLQCESLFK